jgi:amino acid transporter
VGQPAAPGARQRVAVSPWSQRTADGRDSGAIGTVTGARNTADRRPEGRPIGPWAFAAVAVTSFGGPLALAALIAPGVVADAGASAGLAMLAAVVVFTVPLAIWLRYSRHVNSAGGLYAFVEAAAGRKVALVQAAIWIVSYVLYLLYTTVQIVYDLLPEVIPAERRYQTLLALLIPVTLAAVMIAGRRATLLFTGVLAAGQLALAGALDGVTIAHVSTPASSFAAGAPTGSLATGSAQTALLYICGSLPLFLGGEVARPARTIRRGVIGAYLVSVTVVVAAVAPLAAAPGLLHTEVPGVSVAQQFAGRGFADVLGVGIAVSIGGVMLVEYLALSRLVHAISSWRLRPVTVGIGAVLVAAAPFMSLDPAGFDDALVKPSLVALWLSQLIVFAVYPRFAGKHGQRTLPAWILSLAASAFAIYGLWVTLHHASS